MSTETVTFLEKYEWWRTRNRETLEHIGTGPPSLVIEKQYAAAHPPKVSPLVTAEDVLLEAHRKSAPLRGCDIGQEDWGWKCWSETALILAQQIADTENEGHTRISRAACCVCGKDAKAAWFVCLGHDQAWRRLRGKSDAWIERAAERIGTVLEVHYPKGITNIIREEWRRDNA